MEQAVAAGVDWVQIRERALEGRALLVHAEAVAAAARRGAAARGGPVRILVNRRADVALALGADGVHLGYDAVSPTAARRLLGPGRPIGVSAHAAPEVVAAARAGADYAHLAPIFPPRSKPPARPALGPALLAAAAAAGIAVLAQGGIDPERARSALAAGAAGVAVTGAILLAERPGHAAAALRAALDAAAQPAPAPGR